jgi:hypothetical protein
MYTGLPTPRALALILLVAVVKVHFAADGRDSEAVAVVANALDHAVHQPLGAVGVRVAEAKRIQLRNRACAHGKNVAVDAAHAGGCALIGFHGRGVVVRLDFKRAGQSVADVDESGVLLAGLRQHVRTLLRQGFQPNNRVFVGTVLAPHHRIHAQLGEVGHPAEACANRVKFFG